MTEEEVKNFRMCDAPCRAFIDEECRCWDYLNAKKALDDPSGRVERAHRIDHDFRRAFK